ncbi:cytochrome P450 [Lenzites betulinus]|nr:cytochrome P450 [Lenzites betulinus]
MLQYIVVACFLYGLWKFFKWVSAPKSPLDNIHGPPSPSWLMGNMIQFYEQNGWGFHHELQTKYAPISRIQAMFGQPMLYVYDPAAMNTIVLKDRQQHLPLFEEVPWFMNVAFDSFGPGIFSTTGEAHRRQRKILSPVFSTKNLKILTPVFYEVAHRLNAAIKTLVTSGAEEVDIAKYMGRAALELIGQAALGHCFDPLTEEGHHPYANALRCYIPALTALTKEIQLYNFARPLVPVPLRRPLMNAVPSRRVKELLRVLDTMHENAVRIYTEKKDALELADKTGDEGNRAKDLVTLLLRANAGASSDDALPEDELIAQLSTMMFAATDTTSNALTLIFECLAKHPQAQDRLRQEIVELKNRHNGVIPYDELMSLPYLEAVCSETMRVYVPTPLRVRQAQADAVLPLSRPITGKDGSQIDSVAVPKGTLVFVAVQAININPDIWGPDGREWRPERWLEPLPETVAAAKIPGAQANIMTFYGGGRGCMGFKFAQIEMKVILAELLSTFRFETTDAPIVWKLAEVIFPTVGAEAWQPGYPMKVTLVE